MTRPGHPELAEHVATYAAERGDTELEQLCDDVMAGLTEESLLMAVVSGDPELQAAVERGRNAGWRSRRAPEDLAATRAHFDIGSESEICMCGHHRVKHRTVACLVPVCSCKGFASQHAARILQAGFERATLAITGRPYAEVAADTVDPAPASAAGIIDHARAEARSSIYRMREQVYRIRYDRERAVAIEPDHEVPYEHGVSWPVDLGESG